MASDRELFGLRNGRVIMDEEQMCIRDSCCIVATALREYFVHGTPVEDTINGCDDIFQFQIIAKAGVKYREAYHLSLIHISTPFQLHRWQRTVGHFLSCPS